MEKNDIPVSYRFVRENEGDGPLLGNLLNIHDLSFLMEKIRQGDLSRILSKVFLGPRRGGGTHWEEYNYPLKHWWDIPEVMQRWSRMISGDPGKGYLSYFFDKYLKGERSLKALTLGCGTGHREVELAESGIFSQVEGIDFSAARIKHAREWAARKGVDDIVDFTISDVNRIEARSECYDFILAEQALHHFSHLEEIFAFINNSLKPEGKFVFNEYVGPSRFQWTGKQLEMVNDLLSTLPVRYRRRWRSGTVKKKVHRRGRLSMILYDRTEAVRSSDILPLIQELFKPVEFRGYGGSILQLLFADIAHNFRDGSDETGRLLKRCFDREDEMLSRGEISHDFVVGLCERGPRTT